MRHTNRQRANANVRRRTEAEKRQTPLPLAEQLRRAEANRAAKHSRYPVPPLYRPAHNATCPEQPWCYLVGS